MVMIASLNRFQAQPKWEMSGKVAAGSRSKLNYYEKQLPLAETFAAAEGYMGVSLPIPKNCPATEKQQNLLFRRCGHEKLDFVHDTCALRRHASI